MADHVFDEADLQALGELYYRLGLSRTTRFRAAFAAADLKLPDEVETEFAIHQMSKTRAYGSWRSMIDRCRNPGSSSYVDYGGRGIRVCPRWKVFANFYRDMGERPAGKTLDRLDPNGNYEPKNCRWATPIEQAWNTRNRRLKSEAIGQRFAERIGLARARS
jgi:hypothetical protein